MGSSYIVSLLLLLTWEMAKAGMQEKSDPGEVRIGGLVACKSSIGRVAMRAMEMAVADINIHPTILNSTRLTLRILDTNCTVLQGASAAVELLKQEVVAVVGPQSSEAAHFIAHLGSAARVPIISFAATDPSLSEHVYPYFFRVIPTDVSQMAVVASMVRYYGWTEVVALCSGDDYGLNGIAALSGALAESGARVVKKVALAPSVDSFTLGSILLELRSMRTRIFVVHMPCHLALAVLREVSYLQMMTAGYVWIVTDLVASTLDIAALSAESVGYLQGVLGTRSHISRSPELLSFLRNWTEHGGQHKIPNELITYGLFAYDSVWAIAIAVDAYHRANGGFVFKGPLLITPSYPRNASDLAQLKASKGGTLLRRQLLRTNFSGVSGQIQLDGKGDRIPSSFEIVNFVGRQRKLIGYWKSSTGLSTLDPDQATRISNKAHKQLLLRVIWPGGISQPPRGWVLPENGRPLKIAVPHKTGYEQFVSMSVDSNNATAFEGYCIDVFDRSLKKLQYSVSYEFVPYGSGNLTPIYDGMIRLLAEKVVDGIVGDITIVTKRMEKVDFTQPYIGSGLVVLVPIKSNHHGYAWAFLTPFTPTMWATTGAFFILTGIVVWMLEHKKNQDFRGRLKKQFVTLLWFSFSTLFASQRETTKSMLGRCVIIIWLFVVLIITSSYTANLTSILTVQQLSPTIQGINSLQESNVPIGYQTGSFARNYLLGVNIASERLKPYSSVEEYEKALILGPYKGGVAAVVDELPYIQLFLASKCGYMIVGQEFTKGGWGFAFPKGSELAKDLSGAILSLSESGELQKIHDLWLSGNECNVEDNHVDSNQLGLDSFWGLFMLTGLASFTCLLVYIIRLLCQFIRRPTKMCPPKSIDRSFKSKSAHFVRSFASYFDERAETNTTSDTQNQPDPKKQKTQNMPKEELTSIKPSGSFPSASV